MWILPAPRHSHATADACLWFFFFQAEDGIRDYKVTGVQTCALPICPNVLLLDIEMPRMCGLEALKRLRTFSAFAQTTIIVFSASDNPDHVAEAYNRGDRKSVV